MHLFSPPFNAHRNGVCVCPACCIISVECNIIHLNAFYFQSVWIFAVFARQIRVGMQMHSNDFAILAPIRFRPTSHNDNFNTSIVWEKTMTIVVLCRIASATIRNQFLLSQHFNWNVKCLKDDAEMPLFQLQNRQTQLSNTDKCGKC